MIEQALIRLFENYISAFKQYDISAVKACYQLPCTLHTPDKIAYLETNKKFELAFSDIFTGLQHAKTQNIVVTKATYNESINGAIDACIDWAFFDDKNEMFADFCAFYHLIKTEQDYKIVSVVSHQLSNSVVLKHNLVITI